MNSGEARRYAQTSGILLVVSVLAGGFGEAYVPGKARHTSLDN
ncbi:MAG: hypothetical protein ABR905_11575 [Terracidiphilus sp.]|jgi:hypothetical protein